LSLDHDRIARSLENTVPALAKFRCRRYHRGASIVVPLSRDDGNNRRRAEIDVSDGHARINLAAAVVSRSHRIPVDGAGDRVGRLGV
jgi:hypothetical protein